MSRAKKPVTRLFAEVLEGVVSLSPAQRHHLLALRVESGDRVWILGAVSRVLAEVRTLGKTTMVVQYLDVLPLPGSPLELHLVQSLPKADKMVEIIQSCTELGLSRLIPVVSERSVSVPDPGALEKKQQRWHAVAESAAIQSQQWRCPHIDFPQKLSEWEPDVPYDLRLVCWEEAAVTETMHRFFTGSTGLSPGRPMRIVVVIGSEGGLSVGEVDRLRALGFSAVSFGETILRVEHAGFFAFAQIRYAVGGDGCSRVS